MLVRLQCPLFHGQTGYAKKIAGVSSNLVLVAVRPHDLSESPLAGAQCWRKNLPVFVSESELVPDHWLGFLAFWLSGFLAFWRNGLHRGREVFATESANPCASVLLSYFIGCHGGVSCFQAWPVLRLMMLQFIKPLSAPADMPRSARAATTLRYSNTTAPSCADRYQRFLEGANPIRVRSLRHQWRSVRHGQGGLLRR